MDFSLSFTLSLGALVMSNHVMPIRTYLIVFSVLIALTGLTVWAAYMDFGAWDVTVALGIASFKAILVVLYFMHVKENEPLIGLFIVGGVFWLAVMLVFTVADYVTREWLPVEGWF